ncbi:MAG: TerB family tellurite resistance protein [Pseudomonadales bacterium]
MNIDTDTIRRLRDGLVQSGADTGDANSKSEVSPAHQQAAVERFAPFAETMYLMMLVDGDAASIELDAIRGALQILTDGVLDETSLNDLFRHCAREVEKFGVEGRLQFVGARLSADRVDRETAFSLAAAVAIADNKIEDTENALMGSIAEWYGISGKRCKEILQQI